MQRKRLLVAAAMPLLLLIITAVVMSAIARTGGPLQSGSTTLVQLPTADGQIITWGMPLPENTTAGEIALDWIELMDVQGLDIVGLVVHRIGPGADVSYMTADGFPPAGVVTAAPAGSVLPRGDSGAYALEVLVGVRRSSGFASGTVGGLRVQYRWAGVPYEGVLAWGLELHEIAPTARSQQLPGAAPPGAGRVATAPGDPAR